MKNLTQNRKILIILLAIQTQLIFVAVLYLSYTIFIINKDLKLNNKLLFNIQKNQNVSNLSFIKDNDIIIGNKLSKLTLIVYSKFGCDYCYNFFKVTFPELKYKYIDNDKLKLVIRFVNNKYDEFGYFQNMISSILDDEGKFVEFIENKYLSNSLINSDDYYKYISTLDIDTIKVKSKINSNEYQKGIDLKISEAYNSGIILFPSFIFENRLIVGDIGIERLSELIEYDLELKNEK